MRITDKLNYNSKSIPSFPLDNLMNSNIKKDGKLFIKAVID